MSVDQRLAKSVQNYLRCTYGMSEDAAKALQHMIHERPKYPAEGADWHEMTVKTPELIEFALAWTKWTKWIGV